MTARAKPRGGWDKTSLNPEGPSKRRVIPEGGHLARYYYDVLYPDTPAPVPCSVLANDEADATREFAVEYGRTPWVTRQLVRRVWMTKAGWQQEDLERRPVVRVEVEEA